MPQFVRWWIPVLCLSLLVLLAPAGVRAITVNSTSDAATGAAADSLTWSHTVASGDKRLLTVSMSFDGAGYSTGVTYGGTSFTLVGRYTSVKHTMEIWRLTAPPVGMADITATFSGSMQAIGGAVAFNDVDQTTPTGTFESNEGTAATASVAVSSATGEMVIDALITDAAAALTVGAGQTEQWQRIGAFDRVSAGSTEPGAASVTMSWDMSPSDDWTIVAVPIKPCSGGFDIAGRVFEDADFAGTASAYDGGVGDQAVEGVDVELYYADGDTYITSVTTDASGNYTFGCVADSTYKVRVRSATFGVAPATPLGGLNASVPLTWPNPVPEMTWGDGAAKYGGQSPTVDDISTGDDAGPGDTYLPVTVSGANVTGVDFGFAYNLIVNTSDDANVDNVRSTQGSLRQFLKNANAITGADSSWFRIPITDPGYNGSGNGEYTISVAAALPSLSERVTLDGATHPDYTTRPLIELDGGAIGGNGITVDADSCTVRALSIHGFVDGISVTSDGNLIIGNHVGTNVLGSAAGVPPNTSDGVFVTGARNRVDSNVLSGNAASGLWLSGADSSLVVGNLVGTNADGNASVGNGSWGIRLSGSAVDNTIGGTDPSDENVVSGNAVGGIRISSPSATGNVIQGNRIGTDLAGTGNVGNSGPGIKIHGETTNATIGGLTAAAGNTIAFNDSAGVYVEDDSGADPVSNAIRSNEIFSNGGLGIDLEADGVTENDAGDGDGGANEHQNFPVITSATSSGATTTISGTLNSHPTARFYLDFFSNSAVDASGNGEGEVFLGTDSLTTDGSGNGSFTSVFPVGTTLGDFLTATATDSTGNTSEFSDTLSVTTAYAISGKVFEDVNYGGGTGRDLTAAAADAPSFTVERNGVTVELYDSGGSHVTAVSPQVTAGSGDYSFTGLAPGTYTVRAVNGTVASTRTGSDGSEVPVQTYRLDGASEGAGDGAKKVGGEKPSNEDAAANSGVQTLAALQGTDVDTDGITEWTQSIVSVDASAGDVTGVDFGFNFDTVVNTNDQDHGSLRQFILNSNLLANTDLDQDGLTAGVETSVFMIPSDTDPLGRTKDSDFDAIRGVAVITPATALDPITADSTAVDGTTQTTDIGNTNSTTLGTGGTVGTGPDGRPGTADESALGQVAGPEIEIRDTGALTNGLLIQADGAVVRGLAIYGFGADNGEGAIRIDSGATAALIEDNVLGSTASSFTDPGAALRNYEGVDADGATGGTIRDNLIGFGARRGIFLQNNATGWTIENNEIRDSGLSEADGDGISTSQATGNFTGNLITGSSSQGIAVTNAAGNVFTNNTITGNGVGIPASVVQSPGVTLRPTASLTTFDRNVFYENYGAGLQVNDGATGTRLTKNSFYDNGTIVARTGGGPTGQIGIDLNSPADDANLGTAPFYTINDDGDGDSGGNALFNFAVLDSALIVGANLVLAGWARPNSVIELYITDGDPSNFGEGETYLITLTEGGTGAGGDDPYADQDGTSSGYGPAAINGVAQGQDTTNRFRFSFPKPAGVADATALTATARDGLDNTSEFAARVAVQQTWSVSGTVYHDVNGNGSLDAGELGVGSTTWVKLILGGTTQQVVQPDVESGAYSFSGVPDASYTVIVDDNGTAADTTPTEPVNWLFENPGTGSRAVTVAGANVTDEDFGFTFDYDIAADCDCGEDDLSPTLVSIVIDGDNDVDPNWAGPLADLDNNACDESDDNDRDHPVQSTGRNIVKLTYTYDPASGPYFYILTQRVGQSNNTQNFLYYADSNNNGLMEAGEPVVVAKWQGNTGNVDLELYGYDDLGSGGDPMLDGDGYSDGYSLPGDLTFDKALPAADAQGQTSGDSKGALMEWRVLWTDLGVAPGAAIQWHVASTNANPGGAGLAAQIDDNVGGCGGQCAGSNQFGGVLGSTETVMPGATNYIVHAITNTGNGDDLFDLTWSSSGDFAPTDVRFYEDLGTVGEYDDGIDVLLTDTDADLDPDTGTLTFGTSMDLIVAVDVPGPPASGDATLTLTATSNFQPGCGGTIDPTQHSIVNPLFLPEADLATTKTDGVVSVIPGEDLTYTITVTNGGPDSATAVAVVDSFDVAIFDVPSITWTCSISSGNGTCGAGAGTEHLNTTVDLDSAAVATFTVTAPTLVTATGTITNTATATAVNETDPAAGNDSATDNDTVLSTAALSGRVWEDVNGDANLGDGAGVPDAIVRVYIDDGDDAPDAPDTFFGADTTDASGDWSLTVPASKTYWVVVDSKTVTPSAGFNAGSGPDSVWAEQTYGVAGCWCDDGAGGTTELGVAGACYGGQSATVSDDASAFLTAEHIVRVEVAGAPVAGVDVGFSFVPVVNDRDGDDDGGAERTIQGSLRQFLQNANSVSGTQASVFRVPTNLHDANGVAVIAPATALPAVTDDETSIDGTSQTAGIGDTNGSGPEVEVNGTAVAGVDGITITSADNTVKGLIVNRFDSANMSGIRIDGASATDNVVRGCYLGTNHDGTADLGNYYGIFVTGAATADTLGGTGGSEGNLISGNDFYGIRLGGGGTDGHVVLGNQIGTNAAGTGAVANGYGLVISASASNTLGGAAAGAENLISGNTNYGIFLFSSATGNTIEGNLVGTQADGVSALANGAGIVLSGGSSSNTIGGSAADEGNVIGFNTGAGVQLLGATTDANEIRGNSIFENGALGIDLDAGSNEDKPAPVIDAITGGSDFAVFVTAESGDTVEFFRVNNAAAPVATPDGSGAGEGYLYLGECVDGGACSGPHMVSAADEEAAAGEVKAVLASSGLDNGDVVSATATDAFGTSEFASNFTADPIEIVKRAFQIDGTPVVSASTAPKGARIKYLLYVNNPGTSVTDVSLQDVLDPAFVYQTGTIRFDNTVNACADGSCTGVEEAAIFAAADGGTAGSDAADGDVVSLTGVTIDAGDEAAANARLDIAAGKVWSMVFTVKVN